MAIGPHRPGTLHSEINVTPLVDVVLVLLIIFMVVVPLTLEGYDLDIPAEQTAAATTRPAPEQVVLHIDAIDCPAPAPPLAAGVPANCRVRLNDDVLAAGELQRRVAEVFATRELPDRVLFLAVDARLNYETVMRIVDAARSGIEGLRIGLVAREQA